MGKTTCAAALAIAVAERGRRVLLVSMDPAHSLGDALGRRLGRRPVRVATRRGRLDAVELDADRALGRWLASRRVALRAIAERGTYLDDQDIDRLLRLSLPGVDELVGLLELARLAARARPDEVVVDTAPTGHALRLLAMPETMGRIAGVLDQLYAKHRFLAEHLGGAYRPDASDAVIEELAAEGDRLGALLRDRRRCIFSWVLLPETLAAEEARDAVTELDRRGMAVAELIVNRVLESPRRPCAVCTPRVGAERAAIELIRCRLPSRPLRWLAAAACEPRGIARLRPIGGRLARPLRAGALPRLPGHSPPARPAPRHGPVAGWPGRVVPPGTRLVLVVGKGGVGKTTCAATIALAVAARSEERVLLLSTDPAHSLGDVLAAAVDDVAHPLAAGPPRLAVRELDAEAEFRARRARYQQAVEELFAVVRPGGGVELAFERTAIRQLIDLAPPGLDELFALLSVTEVLFPARGAAGGADLLVVDSAPTGHALRLLALPPAALEWVRALLTILVKYRALIRPGRLGQDLVELSRGLRALDALLHDPRACRVVVVTRAGEVVGRETRRLLDRLAALRLPVSALVVNALTPAVRPRCPRCLRSAAAEARQIAAIRREWLARGRGAALLLAPALAPPPRGIRALTHFGRTWTEGGA